MNVGISHTSIYPHLLLFFYPLISGSMTLHEIVQYCIMAVFCLLTLTSCLSSGILMSEDREEITIEIGLYSSISPSVGQLFDCFHYSWESQGIFYQFNVTMIDRNEVLGYGRALNTDNYDVVVIGASGRQYFHGLQETWRNNIKCFLTNGGGYVGICGGANSASQGMETPDSLLGFLINQGALKIANVYINDDQTQEWQYLWKDAGEDHIPLSLALDRSSHPLFGEYPFETRSLTYGGGPGMYPAHVTDPCLGDLVPLAIFLEEPSTIAPLHYYLYNHGTWDIQQPITTDIQGQYAILSTLYNTSSRIILFSPHPEIPPLFDGHIQEYLGISIYGIPRFVYDWVGGHQTASDYNWWMVRRAAAWAAHLPAAHLPPVPFLS